MTVLNLRKLGKPLVAAVCIMLFAIVATSIFNYGREYRAARVDRSSAMQVVKPLSSEPANVSPAADFFTEYRLERDRLRSERSELLREVFKNARGDDSRQKTQDAILKLTIDKQRESEMENLIKARGFADALVFLRDNTVSVVVKAQTLSREEVIQVADIISRVAGVGPEDITISAKP
ncbi:MAG: SpoIIIAH-like family protein [Negativicutes bacterium]|nr:SpoIIIAH-like family protein [Negativicutes bacterium]